MNGRSGEDVSVKHFVLRCDDGHAISLDNAAAALRRVELGHAFYGCCHSECVVDEESITSGLDDLGGRTLCVRDDASAARHRLSHHTPKGLAEADGHQERVRSREQIESGLAGDLADVLNGGSVNVGRDLACEELGLLDGSGKDQMPASESGAAIASCGPLIRQIRCPAPARMPRASRHAAGGDGASPPPRDMAPRSGGDDSP